MRNIISQKTLALASTLGLAVLLSACATTPNNSLAIQKENNQYEVTGLGKTQIIAKNNAISAANKSCSRRTTPVIINENSGYQGALKGVVSDDTGKIINAAVGILGSVTGMRGGMAQDDDYQTTLTFRCQAQ